MCGDAARDNHLLIAKYGLGCQAQVFPEHSGKGQVFCTFHSILPLQRAVEHLPNLQMNQPPLLKQFRVSLTVLIPPQHLGKLKFCLDRVNVYDCSYNWYKGFSVILNIEGGINKNSYIFLNACIHVFTAVFISIEHPNPKFTLGGVSGLAVGKIIETYLFFENILKKKNENIIKKIAMTTI